MKCFTQEERDSRFFELIHFVPESGCWIHTGAEHRGYSFVGWSIPGRRRGTRAHRWSYERFVGPIPFGQVVAHKCDVRSCVNPAHLFACSALDNERDKQAKGRVLRGIRIKNAKLSDEQITEIREWRKQGASQYKIAALFHVDQSTISYVLSGKTWRHVT